MKILWFLVVMILFCAFLYERERARECEAPTLSEVAR